MNWKNVKEDPPVNGEYVLVLLPDRRTDIACYCNDEFYKLIYDPHLDILRKTFYDEKVDCWSKIPE